MNQKRRVAGYVKLAKLWERSRESALAYHQGYYQNKYLNDARVELVGVYVDITGQRQTHKRPEMVRLLKACSSGRIDCIAAQTKAYLAADSRELCCLLKFLFDLPGRIDLVTEDEMYKIDTIEDADNQRDALRRMAEAYAALEEAAYDRWKAKLVEAMGEIP